MQDLSKQTWSSWCRHLKPGIDFAKVHTWNEKYSKIQLFHKDNKEYDIYLAHMIHKPF